MYGIMILKSQLIKNSVKFTLKKKKFSVEIYKKKVFVFVLLNKHWLISFKQMTDCTNQWKEGNVVSRS